MNSLLPLVYTGKNEEWKNQEVSCPQHCYVSVFIDPLELWEVITCRPTLFCINFEYVSMESNLGIHGNFQVKYGFKTRAAIISQSLHRRNCIFASAIDPFLLPKNRIPCVGNLSPQSLRVRHHHLSIYPSRGVDLFVGNESSCIKHGFFFFWHKMF